MVPRDLNEIRFLISECRMQADPPFPPSPEVVLRYVADRCGVSDTEAANLIRGVALLDTVRVQPG